MPSVAAIVEYLEQFAPPDMAAGWDNVGLLLGERGSEVRRIMTCLTLTPASAAEAAQEQVGLVVAHHPILFRGTKRLTSDTPEGRTLLCLARAGVAVYSPHTAFDNTTGGINDLLASRLGLTDLAPLRPQPADRQYKIVVFVPDSDLNRVADALFAAGAGNIGQYSQCSFRLEGTGTFFGSEAANPTVGQKGRREEVREWRLEAVCPEASIGPAVSAMRRAHSYEEPAYDIYPLHTPGSSRGEGRIGSLPAAMPLAELARQTKAALSAGMVQVIGELARPVQRVAIVCGAGGEMLTDAVRSRVDVFLSGELRFHDYLEAQARGLALILPGHYATERPGIEDLARRLQQQWPALEVWPSRREQEPVQWV